MIDRATDIVTLQPIYHMVNEALLTLLGGLAIWLSSWVKAWLENHAKFLSEQTDAQLADGLNRALQNGVRIAIQQADDLEKDHPGIPVKSQIAAWAANYAVQHSPAAIERFSGLSLNDLAIKALAYLPPAQEDMGIHVPAPVTVEAKTLKPVQ